MPIFAAFFGSLFGALGSFLAKIFLAKVAIRVAAVAGLTAIGSALMVTFNTHVTPLVAAAFSTQYGQFLGLAFPPIAGTCIAVFTTVLVACWSYKLQARAIMATAGM